MTHRNLGDTKHMGFLRSLATRSLWLFRRRRSGAPVPSRGQPSDDRQNPGRAASPGALGPTLGRFTAQSLVASLKAREATVSRTYDTRSKAVSSLEQLGSAAVPALLTAIDHEEKEVREMTAWTLGRIGDPRALDSLVACLHDTSSKVRRAAVCALGRIGHKNSTPAVLTALRDQDPFVCFDAAEALGKFGDEQALRPLMELAGTANSFAEVKQKIPPLQELAADTVVEWQGKRWSLARDNIPAYASAAINALERS